jgi:hypothetical protein
VPNAVPDEEDAVPNSMPNSVPDKEDAVPNALPNEEDAVPTEAGCSIDSTARPLV